MEPARFRLLVARFVDADVPPEPAAWPEYPLRGNDLGQARERAPVVLFDSRALAARAPSTLTPSELDRASRFRHEGDRSTYLGVHTLLRIALARRTGVQPQHLRFGAGSFGKPVLEPGTGAHFSVSYRRGWGAIALAEAPVGVDIETMSADEDAVEIARRSFHPDEAAHLRELGDDAFRGTFLELWTRKEALIKAAGLGVDYMPATSALKSHARLMDDSGTDRTYGIHQFQSTADFALALAIQS
jgi:phosphopantetheine--protein transferase-like protein